MSRGEFLRQNPDAGYSGTLAERDMFGDPWEIRSSDTPEKRALARRFCEEFRSAARAHNGYLPFLKALNFVRERQIDNPETPFRPFAAELLCQIEDILISEYGHKEVAPKDLRFYSAVGTPLDIFHGIDAWVEILDRRTREYLYVTLDVTQNLQKLSEGHKADVMVPVIQNYPQPSGRSVTDLEKANFLRERRRFITDVRGVARKILFEAFGSPRR